MREEDVLVATTRRPLRTRRPTAFPDPHTTAFPSRGRGDGGEVPLKLTKRETVVQRTGRALGELAVVRRTPSGILLRSSFLRAVAGRFLVIPGPPPPGMELGDLCALGYFFHFLLTGQFPKGAICRGGNEGGQEEQQVRQDVDPEPEPAEVHPQPKPLYKLR